MTVLLADGFNRTGANLGSNPAGRWNLPAPGSGTNDWTLDGQAAKSTAVTSSTRGWARFISPSAGVKYGEVRARLRRAHDSLDVVGLVMHADRVTMADVSRLAFVHNDTLSRYELRHYTAYDTFGTAIATVTEAVAGIAMDTADHLWKFRVSQLGGSTSTTLQLSASIDNVVVFANVTYPDFLSSADTNNRAPGFEVLHTSSGSSSVYLAVDEFVFDDLVDATGEVAPSLTAEPTLTPASPGGEGTASGTTPVTPDFGEVITERYFVARTDTEAGYQVTWALHQDRRRLWRIVHNSLLASELTTLDAFLVSHNGAATPWTYDTPEGSTAKVYFVDDTFAFTRLPSPTSAAVYRCEYVVEEVG